MSTQRTTGIPPVVYVGPTISPDQVRQVLPHAEIRPPIRRGDLYRDRMLRHSVFVVIDGVFHQHQAVPMREIVDVCRDDAWVVGASSMGALRAAECWPAGMEGVGVVYRLFRRGSLESDDEVAVAFDPDVPQRSSVPLVTVRHALRHAVRRGLLDRSTADRSAAVAAEIFYSERTWRLILERAGVADPTHELEGVLTSRDLKRDDAAAALRRVARRLESRPDLAVRPRRATRPFVPTEATRERDHSALGSISVATAKVGLARFVIAGGHGLVGSLDVADPLSCESDLVDRVWDDLHARGELDAALFRWRAVSEAAQVVRVAGLTPHADDRQTAEREIADAHGYSSYGALEAALTGVRRAWVSDYRDQLTWAKCLRRLSFNSD